MPISSQVTVALAQIDATLGDLKANVARHLESIAKAKEGGADLVVFPELSLTGYAVKDLNWDAAVDLRNPSILQPLIDASRHITIIAGGIEESERFGLYNVALVMEAGEIRHVHRKVYTPTYGLFEEARHFLPGDKVRAFDSRLGRTGVLVCEDMWHVSLPYLLTQQGTWLIVGIHASPTRIAPGEKDMAVARINEEHYRVYARLLGSYVVFCNRVGVEDGVGFWGGSLVADPSGELVVQAKYFDEDLVFARIDTNVVARARRSSRHVLDENPDIVLRELTRLRSGK